LKAVDYKDFGREEIIPSEKLAEILKKLFNYGC